MIVKKIVAAGGGYIQPDRVGNYLDYVVALTGKTHPVATIIPTAGWDNCDDNCDEAVELRKRGCDVVNLLLLSKHEKGDKIIEDMILSADLIWVPGGNLKRLMDEWKRTGADEILKEAYNRGIVLAGSSSGAMCWFERGYDDCLPEDEFTFIDCLGLVPFCFSPHYESPFWRSFDDAVKLQDMHGIGVENGCAVTYINDEFGLHRERLIANAYIFDKDKDFERFTVDKKGELLNEYKNNR